MDSNPHLNTYSTRCDNPDTVRISETPAAKKKKGTAHQREIQYQTWKKQKAPRGRKRENRDCHFYTRYVVLGLCCFCPRLTIPAGRQCRQSQRESELLYSCAKKICGCVGLWEGGKGFNWPVFWIFLGQGDCGLVYMVGRSGNGVSRTILRWVAVNRKTWHKVATYDSRDNKAWLRRSYVCSMEALRQILIMLSASQTRLCRSNVLNFLSYQKKKELDSTNDFEQTLARNATFTPSLLGYMYASKSS